MKRTLLLTAITLISSQALASGSYHHNHQPDNHYYTTEVTEEYVTNEYITNEYITSDPRAAIQEYSSEANDNVNDSAAINLSAAALQFDWATNDWQYSGGLGNYANRTAGSIGLAKKVGPLMFNGSYNQSLESGNKGYNLGFTGRFK